MENQSEKNGWTNFGNILILSVGFMLLMAAWLTTAGIELTILQSVKEDDPTFTGDGYLSQAIVNGAFALTNFLAPTIVSIVGVRTTLVVGTCFYTIFIFSFLYPNSMFLYASSALIGFGAANVWVANGIYFTRCSTKATIGKYMGIYWAIMAMGQLLGNGFVFWRFQGMNHIDHETRFLVISILMCLSMLSSITFVFLGKPKGQNKLEDEENELERRNKKNKGILSTIISPFRLLTNKHMLLVIPAAMYNGMEIAFFTAIYPTSVAFSEAFGGDTRKLVGVAGILIGVGTLFGGLFFGILVDKLEFIKSKRNFIVTSSCIAHCISFVLMYINLSDAAPLGPTNLTSWINPPSIPVAMLCAFLLGLGDGCITPQLCAQIGVVWPEDPSSALAIYRFFQAATCATGYFIGTLTGLYNQIIIFLAITLFGTLSFRINEGLIAKTDDYPIKLVDQQQHENHWSISVIKRKISDGSTLKKN